MLACSNFLVTVNKCCFHFSFPFSVSAINCTSLTVDPGGPLRMSSCDNRYAAQCNFSCTIGYRLNGSSQVPCVAPANQHPGVWNNSIPRCEGPSLNNLVDLYLSTQLYRCLCMIKSTQLPIESIQGFVNFLTIFFK